MSRGMKFWILQEEGLYYPCSENKGADQLCGYRKADLRLLSHMQKAGFLTQCSNLLFAKHSCQDYSQVDKLLPALRQFESLCSLNLPLLPCDQKYSEKTGISASMRITLYRIPGLFIQILDCK